MRPPARARRFGHRLALALLGACTVGPNYTAPGLAVPAAYKEFSGWKPASPRDDGAPEAWWQMFGDRTLTSLEERIEPANQTLAAAQAQYAQARALVREARAAAFPTLSLGLGFLRTQRSGTLGSSNPDSAFAGQSATLTRDYTLPLDLSWEVDLWGRVRRAVEANRAAAEASAADLRATRLSLQAELAADYFQLHSLDAVKELLDQTASAYEISLQITHNRYQAGVAALADVVQAEAQLRTTQAQALDVGVQRAQLEHAIAVLTGSPAEELALAAAPLEAEPPAIPPVFPSELLERRPDIAAAERRAAAANAQIGVAAAAFFPQFTLRATGGFETATAGSWFDVPSRIWSLGPVLSQTVFDGGLRSATRDEARAAFDAAAADYRQTVLVGLQEVEDNLAALRVLEDESGVQADAVRASDEAVELTLNQYKAGTVSYTSVITAQSSALANHRTAVELQGRRMTAAVQLVKALGGSWGASAAPRPAPPAPAARP